MRLKDHNQLYAPTYIYLQKEAKALSKDVPYKHKQQSRIRNKGKKKPHEELEKEVAWIQSNFALEAAVHPVGATASGAASSSVVDVEPEDGGIECGCCFSNYAFVRPSMTLLSKS